MKNKMITPEKALEKIFQNMTSLPAEKVNIVEGAGRVLGDDVQASLDLPPFNNSAMDGYAVRADDLRSASRENPLSLDVQKIIKAGSPVKETLMPGKAMKIMTGAPTPEGTDAVVMKEMTDRAGDSKVLFYHAPDKGENIRCHGEDVKSGTIILKKGTILRPYEIALLAAQGISEIRTIKKPVVSIMATGDELINADESCTPGMIYNSNGPAAAGALRKWGMEVVDQGIIKDNPDELEHIVRKSIGETDVVLVSGGVSVGDYDYTRSIFQKIGIREVFWKVAIKPGKPLLFGCFPGRNYAKPIFGLPGNPISLLVCLEEFVRPALEKLQGYKPTYPSYHLQGSVVNNYRKKRERQQYLFCQVTSDNNRSFNIHVIRPQGSALMGMASQANALAIFPQGKTDLKPGDILKFRWLK